MFRSAGDSDSDRRGKFSQAAACQWARRGTQAQARPPQPGLRLSAAPRQGRPSAAQPRPASDRDSESDSCLGPTATESQVVLLVTFRPVCDTGSGARAHHDDTPLARTVKFKIMDPHQVQVIFSHRDDRYSGFPILCVWIMI